MVRRCVKIGFVCAIALAACQSADEAAGRVPLPRAAASPSPSATAATSAAASAKTSQRPPPRSAPNTTQQSFSKAKKAMRAIYADHQQTFYCGCSYSKQGVDHSSCGYVPQKDTKRAHRIEWEHVVPAHAFGHSFVEWRDGHPKCTNRRGKRFKGRNCARKVAEEFRYMEADMHNLVPAIGEVNWLRSNFSFAELDGEPRELGRCDFEIHARKVEPKPAVRGDVARIYQYMDGAYPIRGIISNKNRKLFEAWAAADPVTPWECTRARAIEKIQGNRNEVLAEACAKAGL